MLRHIRISGRWPVAVATVAVLAFLASGCAGTGAGSASGDIRLGYQTNIWGMPIYTAIKNGCFQRENLPIKEIQVDSGNRIRDLMVAGQADVGTFAGPTLVTGMDKSDLMAVGMAGTVAATSAIVVRQDSPIRTLADLRGKKIAVQSGNSVGDVAIHEILPSAGLEPGDYQLVNIPVGNMVSALTQKQIDAMANADPYNAVAVAQGIGRRLVDYTNYDPMPVFIGMRKAFIDQHHQQAVQILRGLLANAQEWQKNPTSEYNIITQYYTSIGFNVPPEVIRDAASREKVQVPYFDGVQQYMQRLAEQEQQLGQIRNIPDFSTRLDTTLLKEANAGITSDTSGCSAPK